MTKASNTIALRLVGNVAVPVENVGPLKTAVVESYGIVAFSHNSFVGRGEALLVHDALDGVNKPTAEPAEGAAAKASPAETAESVAEKRSYVFRGDDNYGSGAVGRALGAEADAADIQNFADHVLRKESNLSSRYVSFTVEVKVARKFTSASDNRYVSKAEMAALRELEAQGAIRIWDPDQVYAALREGPKKLAKQAADVRAAMRRNREILIEGQIPEGFLQPTN